MNKQMLIILLALASLACLETTITAQPEPTSTARPAETREIETGAVFELNAQTPTPKKTCAAVIAIVAVNLRNEPSLNGSVIRQLLNGEVVITHKQIIGWTAVTTIKNEDGYVKSEYLTTTECAQ